MVSILTEPTAPQAVLDLADSALQDQKVIAAFDRLVAYRRNYGKLVADLVNEIEVLGDEYAGPAVEFLLANAYYQAKMPVDPDQAIVIDKGFDEPYPMVGFESPVVGVGSPAAIRKARDSAVEIFRELSVPFRRLVWTDWPDHQEDYEDRRNYFPPAEWRHCVNRGKVKLPYAVSSELSIPGTVLLIDNLEEGDAEDYPDRPSAFKAAEVLHRLKKLYPRLSIIGFVMMPEGMDESDLVTNPCFDRLRAHSHLRKVQDNGEPTGIDTLPTSTECSASASGDGPASDLSAGT